ncbi:MAG: hypothetical protein ACRCU2_13640 [Planktothrix sp.]
MSIGEIIAILALLIAIFQTMLAWMSYEGIRLSLSSSDWIVLFITLIGSAFIVGVLFDASSESLLLFFTGNFIITDLTRMALIKGNSNIRSNSRISDINFFLIMSLLFLVFSIPVASHVCMIESVLNIKMIFNDVSMSNECAKNFESFFPVFMSAICLFFCLLSIAKGDLFIKNNIFRLINWLTCGIGVCLGLLVRLMFVKG